MKVGVFKFSLLATLPVVILVSLATNQKVQEEKMISTFETLVKRHQEAVVAKSNQRKYEIKFFVSTLSTLVSTFLTSSDLSLSKSFKEFA